MLSTPITNLQGAAFNAPPGNGVVATANLTPGITYRSITVALAVGTTPASRAVIAQQVAQVRLLVSGQEVMVTRGAEMVALNQYFSGAAVDSDGCIDIQFARMWGRDDADVLEMALGTSDQTSVQVEITYAGAGVTITSASVFWHSSPNPQPAGVVRMLRRDSFVGLTGAGEFIKGDLQRDPTARLLAIGIVASAADIALITNVRFNIDNVGIINAPMRVLNLRAKSAWPFRVPQDAAASAALAVIDFTADGFGGESLDMSQYGAQQLYLTMSAAPSVSTFPIILEMAGTIPSAPGLTIARAGG